MGFDTIEINLVISFMKQIRKGSIIHLLSGGQGIEFQNENKEPEENPGEVPEKLKVSQAHTRGKPHVLRVQTNGAIPLET